MRPLIIGTRGSELALWQAHFIKQALESVGATVNLKIIKTHGDRIQHLSFDKMEGKGFFTKELEQALIAGSIDVAVHSFKDLETAEHPELEIAAITQRADPRDALLIRPEVWNEGLELPLAKGAVVGTSSARRKMQLLHLRPDAHIRDVRGNVPTRLHKLRSGAYDALIMAKAGLDRIAPDLDGLHCHILEPHSFVPAPAQGALACQVRRADSEVSHWLLQLHQPEVARTVLAERAVLRQFGGGCQIPLGAYCHHNQGSFHMLAVVAPTWEDAPLKVELSGDHPEALASEAAELLKKKKPLTQVFISRAQPSSELSSLAAAHGVHLHGQRCVQHVYVEVAALPEAEWIFFSSPTAVTLFAQRYHIPPEMRIGCIGAATAQALRTAGYQPQFVPTEGPVAAGIESFIQHIPWGERVIEAAALHGLHRLCSALSPEQALPWYFYATIPSTELQRSEAEVLIFTSPSNARSYLGQFPADKAKVALAFGESTAAALRLLAQRCIITAPSAGEVAAWRCLR